MLVSEIQENVDIVLGIKNVLELEGVINLWEYYFSFLNWSIPLFPKEKIIIKLGENKLVRIEAPFTDEVSSLAIVKLLDKLTQSVIMLKVKFLRNTAMLDLTNSNSKTLIFNPEEAIGILDLRSLGYYKIKQGVWQQNLSRYYNFESAEEVCNQFNNLINTLKKEQSLDMGEKYPWLDDTKYMSDREILEKYGNLDNTWLTEEEKRKVMDMLYRYKEVFSLRDEIGTCLNIEVGIDVTDKSSFLLDHTTLGKKIKKVIDKEMKHLCYLGILKDGFSPYSSPVMLISRKLTQDKGVVIDFRHLNIKIAKNNLAYPLVRDTFLVLGNSKCEVHLVLDLKNTFHSLRLLEESKKYCGILPCFGSVSYMYQRMPMGLNISSSIWHINAILECLPSRKHCELIMDDLLLFTPSKKAHMAKLEDLLKALLKQT